MSKEEIIKELLEQVTKEIKNGVDNLGDKESGEFFIEVGCWKFNVVKVEDNWELDVW